MAKHIKTNKIKKRKAAKKTLRKTKRIRQKGKKQSGGLSKTKGLKEWEEFIYSPDEQVEMNQKEANTQCNKIINANFYPPNHPTIKPQLFKDKSKKEADIEAINKNKSVTSIKNNISRNNYIARLLYNDDSNNYIAGLLYKDVVFIWNKIVNSSSSTQNDNDDVINAKKFFGKSTFGIKIKICISDSSTIPQNVINLSGLQNSTQIISGVNKGKEAYLIPFEENDQFKNYEIYQSEPNTQIYTDDSNGPFKEFENDIQQKYENYNNEHPGKYITAPEFKIMDLENNPIDTNNFCFETYNNIKIKDGNNYQKNEYFIIFEPENTNHIYKSLVKHTGNQIDEFVKITKKIIKVLRKYNKLPNPFGKPIVVDSCN